MSTNEALISLAGEEGDGNIVSSNGGGYSDSV